MEAFSSLQQAPQSTMMDMQMDLQVQMPQQTLPPQPLSLSTGECILPPRPEEEDDHRLLAREIEEGRRTEEEKKDDEDDGDELLFDIDEFLVQEEALIHGNRSNGDDGNEGATIIAESPTTTNAHLNPTDNADHSPTTNSAGITSEGNNTNGSNSNAHKKKRKRRPRSKIKPKNLDACTPPKRPLSAYNLYFREARKRCLAETSSSKSSKKYNFEELGKLIGKGWRSLPLKEKQELEARAEADRERYRNEMIAYRREKRRKDREEDEDTLILMRHKHSFHRNNDIQNNARPRSPLRAQGQQTLAQQQLSGSFTTFQRHITVSPGRRDYPGLQDQRFPKNHVRQVSVSISSPPAYRARNNASPAVSSYGSCSSWSGDEYDGDDNRDRKTKIENEGDRRKGRNSIRSEPRSGDTKVTLPNQAVEHSSTPSSIPQGQLQIPCLENSTHKPPAAVSPHGVAVARVVAMPATDGLQRILEDGSSDYHKLPQAPPPPQPSQSSPPPPHGCMPGMHARPQQFYAHPRHPLPPSYPPPPPQSPALADRLRHTPPPPLTQGSFHLFPPPPSSHPARHPHEAPPPPPQMLPSGMEIFLRDPATGRQRSYRVQYTPKFMTAEQANQFQRLHGGGIAVVQDGEEPPPRTPTPQHGRQLLQSAPN